MKYYLTTNGRIKSDGTFVRFVGGSFFLGCIGLVKERKNARAFSSKEEAVILQNHMNDDACDDACWKIINEDDANIMEIIE